MPFRTPAFDVPPLHQPGVKEPDAEVEQPDGPLNPAVELIEPLHPTNAPLDSVYLLILLFAVSATYKDVPLINAPRGVFNIPLPLPD